MNRFITLTTDFGTRDWYVGTMKGVIAGIAPEAQVIDITHEIPPGDIRAGALAVTAAVPYFPAGSIHVVVVDPGVGSQRHAVAIKTDGGTFIGPDNGVLSWAIRECRQPRARMIKNDAWFIKPVSQTFHGRDVFAPVAAHLAAGADFAQVGPEIEQWEKLPWPEPRRSTNRLIGEIIHVDHFGNAISNLSASDKPRMTGRPIHVQLSGQNLTVPFHSYYAEADPGQPLAMIGSSGLLELAIRDGSFAEQFGVTPGGLIEISW